MDESHVKTDKSYKGGRIIGHSICPDESTIIIFAIIVTSVHKIWLRIVRL